jgi:pantothenate kinase type III
MNSLFTHVVELGNSTLKLYRIIYTDNSGDASVMEMVNRPFKPPFRLVLLGRWSVASIGHQSPEQLLSEGFLQEQTTDELCLMAVVSTNQTVLPVFVSFLEAMGYQPSQYKVISKVDWHHLPPLASHYDLGQLGLDRLMSLLVYRAFRSPATNGGATVLIGAGTALTLDVIDEQGVHVGGCLLPGLGLWANSVSQQLPPLSLPMQQAVALLEEPKPMPFSLLGSSTATALHAGLVCTYGLGIKAYLGQLALKTPCHIVMAGGDARVVQTLLEQQGVEAHFWREPAFSLYALALLPSWRNGYKIYCIP